MNPGSDRDARDFDVGQAVAALRWWRDSGVDLALGDFPARRFDAPPGASEGGREPPSRAPEAPARSPPAETDPFGAARAAQDIAAAARDLESLRASLERFEGCGLKKTATQLVFSDGAPGSRVMLIGEAPGAEEDRSGKPFVGRAGQLLDRMLASIGLDRSQVYIANVIPWRPPGNRTPTPQETQACLPFIRRQIELSGAEFLVCLGSSATQTLLGTRDGITRARGRWFDYVCDDGRKLRALAMLHPAYLLRQPAQKRNAWADLRALAQALRLRPEGEDG